MFVANFRVMNMKSQLVDHVLIEDCASVTSIGLPVDGCILSYRYRAKSQATVKTYQI